MNHLKSACLLAGGFLLFSSPLSHGQYSVTGATPGGGEVIVGSGGALGALNSSSTPVALSPGGFDQVTLNIGSVASTSGQDTIQFVTSNDTLVSNGTVTGAAGFNAVSFTSTSSLAGETVTNNGTITVGNFGPVISTSVGINTANNAVGGNAGTGIAITSGGGISGISVSNAGTITAGSFGDLSSSGPFSNVGFNEGSGDIGGNAGVGIAITSGGGISGLSLSNAGTVAAGSFGAISGNSNVGFNESGGDIGGNAGVGIAITSGGGISGLSLSNAGTVAAGSFGAISGNSLVGFNESGGDIGGNAGTAIAITSGGGISGLSLSNAGTVTAGSFGAISGNSLVGYNQTAGSVGANVGTGISITSGIGISGLSLSNAGTVTAGSFSSISNGSDVGYNQDTLGDYGANAGTGVAITSGGGITGLTIVNTGAINGGSFGDINGSYVGYNQTNGDVGANAGVGLAIDSGGAMNTLSLVTQGAITGGNFSSIVSANVGYNQDFGSDVGANAGTGVAITSGGAMNGLFLLNKGMVLGGGFGAISSSNVGFNQSTGDIGGNVAVGLAITTGNTINGLAFSNQGTVMGGSIVSVSSNSSVGYNNFSGDIGGNVGAGVAITSGGGISGLSLVNRGTVTGGSIGAVDSTSFVGYNAATNDAGANAATGIAITSGGAINGLAVTNYGSITGGSIAGGGGTIGGNANPGDVGGDAASGLAILSAAGSGNLVVTNFGTIAGGGAGANAGYGISANTGNLVINNWGAVDAGSGLSTATQPGFPAVAISISGNNNTINLDGHSSVKGTLQGVGSNNLLNLNFTGVSPAALANLKAQLAAQGWPATNNFTGSFTLRGQTYYVDPIPLNINGITSYEGQAQTPNQFAIGANLDSLAYNPAPGTSFFNLLNAIDNSGAVPQALEALSPQGYEIYGDLAIANANEMVLSVDKRLNNLRDGSESIDTTGLGGGNDQTTTAGYSKDSDGKEIVQPSAPEKRWGFFAAGDGLLFRGDPHDVDLQSGKSDNAGAITGVDGKVGENGVVGLLAAYNNSDATFGTENSTAKIDSYSGGVYGSWHDSGFYVNGLAAYTRNDYSSTRNIVFPGFSSIGFGQTHGDQATVNIDGGYDWKATDRVTVGPLVGLQYVNLGVNGFNEVGGSAADLAVGRQEVNSLQSRVGFHADYHAQVAQNVAFATDLTAAWQHEYLDDARAIDADFIGTGLDPFGVETTSPERDSGLASLSLNFTFHDRLTLFGEYSLIMSDASNFQQTFSGGMRISF